jgi:hypothetical protein
MSMCLKTQTIVRSHFRGKYDVFGSVFLPRMWHITTSALRLEANMNPGRVDHVFRVDLHTLQPLLLPSAHLAPLSLQYYS